MKPRVCAWRQWHGFPCSSSDVFTQWDANPGPHTRSEWQWEAQAAETYAAELQETCWAESHLQGRFTIMLGCCLSDNGFCRWLRIWFVIFDHPVLSSQAPSCPLQAGMEISKSIPQPLTSGDQHLRYELWSPPFLAPLVTHTGIVPLAFVFLNDGLPVVFI